MMKELRVLVVAAVAAAALVAFGSSVAADCTGPNDPECRRCRIHRATGQCVAATECTGPNECRWGAPPPQPTPPPPSPPLPPDPPPSPEPTDEEGDDGENGEEGNDENGEEGDDDENGEEEDDENGEEEDDEESNPRTQRFQALCTANEKGNGVECRSPRPGSLYECTRGADDEYGNCRTVDAPGETAGVSVDLRRMVVSTDDLLCGETEGGGYNCRDSRGVTCRTTADGGSLCLNGRSGIGIDPPPPAGFESWEAVYDIEDGDSGSEDPDIEDREEFSRLLQDGISNRSTAVFSSPRRLCREIGGTLQCSVPSLGRTGCLDWTERLSGSSLVREWSECR